MRLTKFLIVVLAITLLALLYVYQQSRIIQAAYQEQERLAFLKTLIDKSNNLGYSISRQTSLVSIAGIWEGEDFEWPQRRQLVSLSTAEQISEDNQQIKESENIFTRLLGLKSQAEATLIKPR
jgi:hypothetical protein